MDITKKVDLLRFKVGAPFLFRFRGNQDFAFEEFSKSYIYFQELDKLNDPFEGLSDRVKIEFRKDELINSKMIKESIPKNEMHLLKNFIYNMPERDYKNYLVSLLKEYIDSFGISCFTMHPTDFLMWSHYADGCRGVCFVYNLESDEEFFTGFQPVKYVPEMQKNEIIIDYSEEAILNLFYEKLMVWKNEMELRLIKQQKGQVKYKANALRGVLFGCKTPDDIRDNYFELAREKNWDIQFCEVKPKWNGKGALITPLN